MKKEHEQALIDGKRLVSDTGYLFWTEQSGYFNCHDPDCRICEDWDLSWEELESWYDQWREEEWIID